jgi:hypothetical protein
MYIDVLLSGKWKRNNVGLIQEIVKSGNHLAVGEELQKWG